MGKGVSDGPFSAMNQLKSNVMVVRFTFRAEVFVKADTLEEAKSYFEQLPLLSADAIDQCGEIVETYEPEIV